MPDLEQYSGPCQKAGCDIEQSLPGAFSGTLAVLGRTLSDDGSRWLHVGRTDLGVGELCPACWLQQAFFFFLFSFSQNHWTRVILERKLQDLNKIPPTRKLCDCRILSLTGFQTWYSLGVGPEKRCFYLTRGGRLRGHFLYVWRVRLAFDTPCHELHSTYTGFLCLNLGLSYRRDFALVLPLPSALLQQTATWLAPCQCEGFT